MMKLPRLILSLLLMQTLMVRIPLNKSLSHPLLGTIATTSRSTSVTLKSKTVRWYSRRKSAGFPEDLETIVRYPIVTGLQDPTVLKKVETAISVKSIVGESLTELKQDPRPWLTELEYSVNYNQNSILDLTYDISGMGAYPSTSQKRVSIDLISGNILRSKDLFKTDRNVALAQSIDKMMQREIKANIIELRRDTPDIQLDIFGKPRFKPEDLNDFTIGKKGITFYYNFAYPQMMRALQPSGVYFMSYKTLSRYIRADGAIAFALEQSSQ